MKWNDHLTYLTLWNAIDFNLSFVKRFLKIICYSFDLNSSMIFNESFSNVNESFTFFFVHSGIFVKFLFPFITFKSAFIANITSESWLINKFGFIQESYQWNRFQKDASLVSDSLRRKILFDRKWIFSMNSRPPRILIIKNFHLIQGGIFVSQQIDLLNAVGWFV